MYFRVAIKLCYERMAGIIGAVTLQVAWMSLKESISHKEVAATAVCQDQDSKLPPGEVPSLSPQPNAPWAVIRA